jgi:small-conductance mechanosensitive channel
MLLFRLSTLLLALFLSVPAVGQEETDDPTVLSALQERLEAAEQELEAAKEEGSEEQTELLSEIAANLTRAVSERRALDEPGKDELVEITDDYTIGSLISLYEELGRNRARIEDLSDAITADREAVATAEASLKKAERERREARDLDKTQPSPAHAQRLARARLESRAAQEALYFHTLELRGDRAALERLEMRVGDLARRISGGNEALRSETSPLVVDDPELVEREGELIRSREAAERERAKIELQLSRSSARYQAQSDPSPLLLEQVETQQLARDALTQKISAFDARLARLQKERDLHARWLGTIRGTAAKAEITEWEDEALQAAQEYQRAAIQRQGRISELREHLDDVRSRLAKDDLAPELRPLLKDRRTALHDLVEFLERDAEEIERHASLQQQFLRVLRESSGDIPFREHLASLGRSVADLWDYEITSVDDEAITVGNALLALILIAIGFSVSRRSSRGVRRLVESRLQLEPGVAGAIQTTIFYVLLVSFGLLALRTVNFPLTAFTVAGGALAIGIGFGSQNVMNNFISGIILLLERPVRAQDVIELENTHGTIEHIGARSTTIRATDGRYIIVPNSFFLENNVVNWTLSDDLIRTKVTVGVIYGSPTRLVRDLIQRVLEENNRILQHPAPIIIFNEFGDNSLNFDAFFWMRARSPMAVNQVASDVRFHIDDLFRENDLVIAFPQRDIHIDSVSPIEVKVLGETE